MNSVKSCEEKYKRAAQAILEADGMLIAAGAGMGVDSGLPDFRGKEGFWRAYPALGKDNIDFRSIASPEAFRRMPRRAWGFYGHRLNLYRNTAPHDGFRQLREIGAQLQHGAFVYTSNVDGQFQKAGFSGNSICEMHGSIHHLQCLSNCSLMWSADDLHPEVDLALCRLVSPLPCCPRCNELARPNIMMFDDWRFITDRVEMQQIQFVVWRSLIKKLVTIEIGAGTELPAIRRFAESPNKGFLIRINPTDARISRADTGVSLQVGALEGLQGIVDAISGIRSTQLIE